MKCAAFYLLIALSLFPLMPTEVGAQPAPVIWAATRFGPYQSHDGGGTWQPIKVTVPSPLLQGLLSMHAIAVDPLDSAKVYFIATVGATFGFFKSTDGGKTWSATVLPGVAARALHIDPVATSTLYMSPSLYRSTDSGDTWTTLSDSEHGAPVVDLATDPTASGVLYATAPGEISKSTDFGNTWSTVRLPYLQPPTLGGISVDPSNGQQVYVANPSTCLDQSRVVVACGIFRSVDAGQTWSAVPLPGTVQSVDVDWTNGNVYAGANETGVGIAVLKSSDQGNTWTPLAKLTSNRLNGPDVSVDPTAADHVFSLADAPGESGVAVDSAGIPRTIDGGATWSKVQFPPYCTTTEQARFSTPSCPSIEANQTPPVYGLAYAAPPRRAQPVAPPNPPASGSSQP